MDFLLAFAVLIAALAVLAYPLYRAQRQPVRINASTLDNLLAERDGIYATLRDLETDKELGKLDDADYNALREKYMTQAAAVLQELDLLRGQGSAAAASAEIETQVAALRKSPVTKRTSARASSGRHCKNCGRACDEGDKFCAKCGHALN